MTEIMPVPRNLSFTVLPAGGLPSAVFCGGAAQTADGINSSLSKKPPCDDEVNPKV